MTNQITHDKYGTKAETRNGNVRIEKTGNITINEIVNGQHIQMIIIRGNNPRRDRFYINN